MIRLAVRAWWHAIIPAALTALTLRAVPDNGWVARLVHAQPVLSAVIAFLLFGAIVRVWSDALPGARIEPRPSRRRFLVVAAALAAVAGVAVGRAYQPARVVSSSMVPTIFPGDRLWVERGRGELPRRGDIIVFQRAGAAEGEPGALAKRVIGLPGDHIAMRDSHPIINGHEVPSCDAGAFTYLGASQVSRGRLAVEWLDGRPYLTVQEPGPHAFVGYDVPAGEVFVLGDNRGVSNDSRSWHRPSVAFAAIEGRADRVLFGDDRRGRFDSDRLWHVLVPDLSLTGVDITALQAGIEQCLRHPP